MIDPKSRGRVGTPFRISFIAQMPQSMDELHANIAANAHVPEIERVPPHGRKLAVVGGGPGVRASLSTIKKLDADIWGINRAPHFLAKHGIRSTMISVDALNDPSQFAEPEVCDGAIFSSWCDPAIVSRYDARIVHMEPLVPGGIHGAVTTAASVPLIALAMGYTDVTFFGCEGSFVDSDHAFEHVGEPHQLIIDANGAKYRTYPEFLMQCQELGAVLKQFPTVFKEASGGLLRAMLEDDNWSIDAVSTPLKDHLIEINGDHGFYDAPYEWEAA